MFFLFAFFKKLYQIFKSDKAKKVFETIDSLVPVVLPIVQSLMKIDPSSTTAKQIKAIYAEYGETVGALEDSPEAFGNALLNLATRRIQKANPKLPISQIQSAILLALTGLKSK